MALALVVACGSAAQPQTEQQPAPAVEQKPVVVEQKQAKADPPKAMDQPNPTAAAAGVGNVVPTIVPGSAPRPAEAPAIARPEGKRGGFVNMDQYADVRQRLIAQSGVLNMNLSPLFNNIMEFNPETPDFNDLRCDLCTHWELAEDAVTYTFHINPAANWWDGMPVSADDVVFSLEAQVNPDQFEILKGRSTSSTVNTSLYMETGGARAIDDKTVEVKTMFPSGAFLTSISIEQTMVQPRHTVLDQGIAQGGRDLWAINGSGPFVFIDYDKEVPWSTRGTPSTGKRVSPTSTA
jgi:ABC-type transport system substrate-binding protein